MNTYNVVSDLLFDGANEYTVEADDVRPVGSDAGVLFLSKDEDGTFKITSIMFNVATVDLVTETGEDGDGEPTDGEAEAEKAEVEDAVQEAA